MGAIWLSLGAVFALLAGTRPALGQELQPRSYSDVPIGTNFAVGTYSLSSGDVSLDPSLPLSDVNASLGTTVVGFSHSFAFDGRTATWGLAVPYLGAHVTAAVYGQTRAGSRYGFADARARFSILLLGRALTPAEFARRKPRTTLGISVSVTAPTGAYDPTHLINIGSNRYSFTPEIGMEQPMGKWFADLAAAVSIFGKNTNYFGGNVLTQASLANYQFHTGYNFRPGQWLAFDANYYAGGSTSMNGAKAINTLANSRYGLTYAQPVGTGFTAKVSWSSWLSGRYGQQFTTTTASLQYRWFDPPKH